MCQVVADLVVERVVVVELRADLGDEREVLEARELAGRHGEDTLAFPSSKDTFSLNNLLFSLRFNPQTHFTSRFSTNSSLFTSIIFATFFENFVFFIFPGLPSALAHDSMLIY